MTCPGVYFPLGLRFGLGGGQVVAGHRTVSAFESRPVQGSTGLPAIDRHQNRPVWRSP